MIIVNYFTPGSPEDIRFIEIDSTTMTLLWEPPSNASGDGTILSYTVSCRSNTDRRFDLSMTLLATDEKRIMLQSLRPYMIYNCCISVDTDMARSLFSCNSQITLEEGIIYNTTKVKINIYARSTLMIHHHIICIPLRAKWSSCKCDD